MKTITDEISKKQMYVLAFAPYIWVWFWVFCIILAAVWYFTKSPVMSFVAAIGIPVLFIKWSVANKIVNVNKLLENLYANTMTSLQRVDYYQYNGNGSIAVDSKAGTISHIKVLPTMEIQPALVFKASDIMEFYFYDPGMTTTKHYGRDLTVALDVLTDNLKAIGTRAEKRGLYIKVDNLQHPKIVMNLTGKEGEYWMLILKKLIDRTLESTSNPKLIP